ncbi:MAG: hypothetical protein ACAI44_25385, partial [Candidatus Sericytochromatia bacterium]
KHRINWIHLYLGFLYGPHDTTDQLYSWLWRFKHQTKVLVPDILNLRFQWAYTGDVSEQLKRPPAPNPGGVYPIITHAPITYGEFFEFLVQLSGNRPKIYLVPIDRMQELGLKFSRDFPMLRPSERLFEGAVSDKLDGVLRDTLANRRLTPFEQSLKETWDYYEALGWPEPKAGLSLARETEILAQLEHD